jgi:copper homeostasis protein (lipoprotein)
MPPIAWLLGLLLLSWWLPVPASQPEGRPAMPAGENSRLMSPLGSLPASFQGEVLIDGQMARWQIDLLPHGRFQFRRHDGGSPAPTDDIGSYRLEGRQLRLLGSGGGLVSLRLQDDGSLQVLTDGGRLLATGPAQRLQRLAQAAPIEPRLRLSGWFTYLADAPAMLLCADGRRLPVTMAGDYLALERAYSQQRPVPGAPVWAEVDGRIAVMPSMDESQPPRPTLVVQHFVRLDPQARCTGPYADRCLTGTDWRLAWLGDEPAEAGDPKRPAGLQLNAGRLSGSDGCNRLMAQATVDGESLRFGPLAGTMMACAHESPQQQDFTNALAQVRSYRIRGDELSLLDAQGVTLLRLQAAR